LVFDDDNGNLNGKNGSNENKYRLKNHMVPKYCLFGNFSEHPTYTPITTWNNSYCIAKTTQLSLNQLKVVIH